MHKPSGPWDPPTPPATSRDAPRLRRGASALVAVAGGIVLILALMTLFPERRLTGEDAAGLAQSVIFLGVLAAGGWRVGALGLGRIARYAVLWLVLALSLFVGAVFWPDLKGAAARLAAAAAPGRASAPAEGVAVIGRDADGSFYVRGSIDGTPIRFLVDTGASDVVLSPSDAERLGLPQNELRFTRSFESANGGGSAAPTTPRTVAVGGVQVADVPIVVNRAPMTSSLLGQSFLSKLKGVRIVGDQMILDAR